MCNPAAAVAAVGIAVSAYGAYQGQQQAKKQARIQQENYIANRNASIIQGYRDLEFKSLTDAFQAQQFNIDMQGRMSQLNLSNTEFNQNAAFKMEQLAYELRQHEDALEAQHLSELSKIDFAGKTMENAVDAYKTDMDLLGEQWNELTGKNTLDTFERKRQAMKEAATIRVSQGESGIFGNTALKEVANSIMQGSYDTSIMTWNLGNQGKQKSAEAKQIKATAKSRTNEAMSAFTSTRLASSTMNPAVAGIQI